MFTQIEETTVRSWKSWIRAIVAISALNVIATQAIGCDDHGRPCETMDLTEQASPDGQWALETYGEACDLGLYSSASVVVRLKRKATGDAQTILGIKMPSQKNLWPRASWISPDELLIRIANSSHIGIQVAVYRDIRIKVVECKDLDAC